jgi:hypothetical protein
MNFKQFTEVPKEILLIVDVQESFESFFPPNYLNRIYELAKTFKNVYQIWDNIDASKPSYTFPNQREIFEKSYGGDYEQDIELYLSGEDLALFRRFDIENDLSNFEYGESFKTHDGRLLVFVGAVHPWFLVDTELYIFLKSIKGRHVTICGGSEGECLTDVEAALDACGVKWQSTLTY